MGYSTALLDKEMARERKELEKMRLQLLRKVPRVLDLLSRKVSFKEAYIFGSLTKPSRFSRRSDVDLGFIGLKDEDFFRVSAYVSGRLGADVDIVQLERHRLKEKIRKEGLRWIRRQSRS